MPSDAIEPPFVSHTTQIKYIGVLPYAICSCGWEGPTRDRDREAADDLRAHEREARRG